MSAIGAGDAVAFVVGAGLEAALVEEDDDRLDALAHSTRLDVRRLHLVQEVDGGDARRPDELGVASSVIPMKPTLTPWTS